MRIAPLLVFSPTLWPCVSNKGKTGMLGSGINHAEMRHFGGEKHAFGGDKRKRRAEK